jgi:hypothetical protein
LFQGGALPHQQQEGCKQQRRLLADMLAVLHADNLEDWKEADVAPADLLEL